MTKRKTFRYQDWPCYLKWGCYGNGRIALQLLHATEHDPVAVATVNVSNEDLGPNEVFIKNYGENEGMLEFLEEQGIVKFTGREVRSGYVEIPCCELLEPYRSEVAAMQTT